MRNNSSATTMASTIAGPSTAKASLIAVLNSLGFVALNPWPPQARASATKSGLGNSMASRNEGKPSISASKGISPKAEIVVNHRLYRQLVMHSGEKLAHEHVETAVAAKSNDLARPIEGLDAICLTESGSDGRVVERTDDSLCSVLPYPVGRPQRVETSIEDEDCIAPGEVADGSRYRLGMDAIGTAVRIGLFVQQLIPLATFSGYAIPKTPVVLRCNPTKQGAQGWPRRAHDAECGRSAASEHLSSLVDLDNVGAFAGQEVRVGIISADHQQQVAMHHRIVDRLGANHAEAAHPAWVLVGHDVLALDRMDQRRLESIR